MIYIWANHPGDVANIRLTGHLEDIVSSKSDLGRTFDFPISWRHYCDLREEFLENPPNVITMRDIYLLLARV